MQKPDALSCCMMALVGAMWGLHGPAIKFAFAAGLTFPQLVFGEYLVGAIVFGLAVAMQGSGASGDRRFWIILVLAGVVGCGVPLFLFWAYRLGPVPIGATLLFLFVPFTQLINAVVRRRAPAPREFIAALLVVAGAVLGADFIGQVTAGNLDGAPFAVLAALCYAGFFVLTSRLGHSATPAFRSMICSAIGCSIMLVLGLTAGWPLVPSGIAVSTAAIWLVSLGVLGQVVPLFLLVNFGPRTGSALGSILTSTELPVAIGASVILLGESVTALQLVGVALVLGGITLPHLSRLGRTAAPTAPSA
jgi:drug/metabolite transporter (DMT)-like permease